MYIKILSIQNKDEQKIINNNIIQNNIYFLLYYSFLSSPRFKIFFNNS